MKKLLLVSLMLLFVMLSAELINVNPDPLGEPWIAGGVSFLTAEQAEFVQTIKKLPEPENWGTNKSFTTAVDNSKLKYFRPIFNQKGGSCAQASGVGYAFTYEMNFRRGADASVTENQYPTHFTYNFLNEGSGSNGSWFWDGWEIIKENGIPNVPTYGGMWPSEDESTMYKIWMDGYEKYRSGMLNRVLDYYYIPVDKPEGLDLLKQWMTDHCDGTHAGGLAVFTAGVGGNPWDTNDMYNLETIIGQVGTEKVSVVTSWDNDVNHAMTFVGYNDSLEWDYNGDGKATNYDSEGNLLPMSQWEVGAMIMANSWGSWGSKGKAWVPYRLLALSHEQGGIYDYSLPGSSLVGRNCVFVVKAIESYPSLIAKTSIDYSVRTNLSLSAGISNDLSSLLPENSYSYQFINKKGGYYGMSGIDNTIEFGLDASMLLPYISKNDNAKFFLGVKNSTVSTEPQGEGSIGYYSMFFNSEERVCQVAPVEIPQSANTYLTVNHEVIPGTYYVNNDGTIGNDDNDGLSPVFPFKTISRAINATPAGSTIILAGNSESYPMAGTFTVSEDPGASVSSEINGLNISKSLTIIGESPDKTIIQGTGGW